VFWFDFKVITINTNFRHVTYLGIRRHPEPLKQLIRDYLLNAELSFFEVEYESPMSTISEAFRGSQAVLFAPGRFLPDRLFEANRHLKLLQIWSSGYDKFNLGAATKWGLQVANNGGANSIAVAEHTIMLMLAVYKRLPEMHQRVVMGNWVGNSHGMNMFVLHRKTLGIVGLGAIGTKVARIARAFGMRVVYFDLTRKPDLESQVGVEFQDLNKLLEISDVVSLHLHLSAESHHLLNRSRLEGMKAGAIVINVSRGQLVDNKALLEGLNSGHLGGAGLDVYDIEPTEVGDPLTSHPNVVCTPHSANTLDTHKMALEASISNIRTVLGGGSPRWLIS
jgi:phosphoglycerate dehydrogenase-like enzyme